MFDMSLTYILVALVAVLLNNVLVERLNLHTRITAGMLAPTLPQVPPPAALTHPVALSLTVPVCKMGALPRHALRCGVRRIGSHCGWGHRKTTCCFGGFRAPISCPGASA